MKERKKQVAMQLTEDHENINKNMGRLKTAVRKKVAPEEFLAWRLAFLWELRDFNNRLLKHFDLEEEGGFMNDVLAISPQSERKVAELKKEHEAIIEDLSGLIARLKKMTEHDRGNIEQLRSDLDDLICNLHRHENEEHILMQRAYYREYGGPA
ncbi:hypothetical protein D6833_05450 [Candidatus Parcubacteria bacterium]|nr:MAG: hypothetical protein D6833_05450 [Candidatus Parcubacteria bacterium]